MQVIKRVNKISCHSSIPLIDLKPYLQGRGNRHQAANLIRKVCKETGFFYISNHGVPQKLQFSILSQMKRLFSLPVGQKNLINIGKSKQQWRGYFQHGYQETSSKPDLKQGIWYGRELGPDHPGVHQRLPFHGSTNPYLDSLPEFKRDVQTWFKEMDRVGSLLSEALAESLGLNHDFFINRMCKDHLGTLGMMHYPPMKNIDEGWGVGEHTDYGFLTLLMFDEPRLQAQTVNDQWVNIESIPDTFVVNIGDILQIMTKGLYKSTLHRARNFSQKSRYSLPYFYDINWHTQIKPLDIKIAPEQQDIIDKVRACKRWDRAQLHKTNGIFGHYVCKKLMKAFPEKFDFI